MTQRLPAGRREVCHCGHDIETHFPIDGVRDACTGVHCECPVYTHEDESTQRRSIALAQQAALRALRRQVFPW